MTLKFQYPWTQRLGMKESLEEYAKRHESLIDHECRQQWRLEAIRLLGLDPANLVPDGRYQPRVCAQACPTNNGPTEIELDEGLTKVATPFGFDVYYFGDGL
jgi:hypothetical protein